MLELNLNISALQLSLSGAPLSHYRLIKNNYEIRDFGNARINLTRERAVETFECPIIFFYDKKHKKEAVCVKRETPSGTAYAIYDYNPEKDLITQS